MSLCSLLPLTAINASVSVLLSLDMRAQRDSFAKMESMRHGLLMTVRSNAPLDRCRQTRWLTDEQVSRPRLPCYLVSYHSNHPLKVLATLDIDASANELLTFTVTSQTLNSQRSHGPVSQPPRTS
jgi:hypothetical protein